MKRIYTLIYCFISLSAVAQEIKWLKDLNYSTDESEVAGIVTDEAGNIYAAGTHMIGRTITNPDPDYNFSYRSYGYFIQKMDSEGKVLWQDTLDNVIQNSLQSLSINETGLYIGGPGYIRKYDFNGKLIVYKAIGWQFNKIALHNNAFYAYGREELAKFDFNFNLIWTRTVAKYNAYKLLPADDNHFYVKVGNGDSYDPDSIVKFDTSGKRIWARSVPGYSTDIAADDEGNCYVSASFLYGTSFGPHMVAADPGATYGYAIAKLSSSGNWEWAIKAAAQVIMKKKNSPYLFTSGGDGNANGLLTRYDLDGNFISSVNMGTSPAGYNGIRLITDIAVFGQSIYAGGHTTDYIYAFFARIDDNSLPLALNEPKKEPGFSVYPNPAGDKINLQLEDALRQAQGDIHLYNVLGKKVKNISGTSLNERETRIDVSDLPKGVYFIDLVTGEGRVTKKIVLQ